MPSTDGAMLLSARASGYFGIQGGIDASHDSVYVT
jgi:hypothetical protein